MADSETCDSVGGDGRARPRRCDEPVPSHNGYRAYDFCRQLQRIARAVAAEASRHRLHLYRREFARRERPRRTPRLVRVGKLAETARILHNEFLALFKCAISTCISADALGTPVDRSRLKDIKLQNVSMNRRKLLFMSQVPKPPEDAPYSLFFAVRFLARVVTASPAIADDGLRYMMSPAERRDLVARHMPGNRAVVERHAITATGGFLDLPDPGETWAPPEPIRAAERRALYRDALGTAWRRHNPFTAARLTAELTRMFAGAALTRRPERTNHVSQKSDAAADFR